MTITASQCKTISAEIDAAVEVILNRHGLQRGRRNARYGPMLKYSIEAVQVTQGRNGVNTTSKEAQDFIAYASALGFKDGHAALGAPYQTLGKRYVLAGYRPRATKHPVLMTEVDSGKQYVFPITVLKQLDGYDPASASAYMYGGQ